MRSIRTASSAAVGLFILAACAREGENEARLLLARYDAIVRAPAAERKPMVDGLRELSFEESDVRRVRDRCVVVFDGMQRAIDVQAELEPIASRLETLQDAGRAVPAEERHRALAIHALGEAALETVERYQDACTDGINGLRSRLDTSRH